MSTLPYPAHRGRSDGARPRLVPIAKPRPREPRPAGPASWPAWTDRVAACLPTESSSPLEPAWFWDDHTDSVGYAITLPKKGA